MYHNKENDCILYQLQYVNNDNKTKNISQA